MADAATAAAIYPCSGHADVSRPAGLSAAIMRYNASDSYVRTVTAIADAYRANHMGLGSQTRLCGATTVQQIPTTTAGPGCEDTPGRVAAPGSDAAPGSYAAPGSHAARGSGAAPAAEG